MQYSSYLVYRDVVLTVALAPRVTRSPMVVGLAALLVVLPETVLVIVVKGAEEAMAAWSAAVGAASPLVLEAIRAVVRCRPF